MMRYITALLALVGFLLLLGAAGDSDRGAGTHIPERAASGVVLLAAGTFGHKKSALSSQPTKARRKSATHTQPEPVAVFIVAQHRAGINRRIYGQGNI